MTERTTAPHSASAATEERQDYEQEGRPIEDHQALALTPQACALEIEGHPCPTPKLREGS